ncbi:MULTISPECIES: carbon storage regulator CsrA [unclassified Cryobacterium]|uniref:carbon storage regulator CsrA n=1 Tax=unclassified Cryobacterium TaxID=2649013 RepID=UPI00106ABC02|nr:MULTISPECIES: carbon storage regulator CsrA [unclassified Cryobacterium]TFB95303.1 carbon storage regulator CsrA [Cryobacterium sp. MDB2-A-1]TFC11338.1 carbon storage regulator CsrA [Cryobacterium sp. MDB2-A-2]TFC11635.1 carbon storage regulator CsrA [Cryobacterium sp. MDB2-33-2]TFC18886.1 carbon storage regulator CsrA [Cryobacterium sp. MDB2-10]
MLVLTRKPGEKILIGDDIVITVLDVRGDSIRIGVDAPRGVKIQRDEVLRAVIEANLSASRSGSLSDEDAEAAEAHLKAALGLLRPPAGATPTPTPTQTQTLMPTPTASPLPHPPLPTP